MKRNVEAMVGLAIITAAWSLLGAYLLLLMWQRPAAEVKQDVAPINETWAGGVYLSAAEVTAATAERQRLLDRNAHLAETTLRLRQRLSVLERDAEIQRQYWRSLARAGLSPRTEHVK